MVMTNQEIFEKVIMHLLVQKKRSVLYPEDRGLGANCAYRGASGLKCAVGALIPDEEYSSEIENIDAHTLIEGSLCPPTLKECDADLLYDLQKAHDLAPNWYGNGLSRFGIVALEVIGERWNLQIPEALNQYKQSLE